MTIGESLKIYWSGRFLAFAPAVLLLLLTVVSFPARAAERDAWVGSWYVELKENGTAYERKYNIRRELIVNRSDGSKVNTFRYYLGKRRVAEVIITYRSWGVDNGVYWTVCRAQLFDGAQTECSNKAEYDVVSVARDELKYKSRQTGIVYSIRRVADSFRLP